MYNYYDLEVMADIMQGLEEALLFENEKKYFENEKKYFENEKKYTVLASIKNKEQQAEEDRLPF